MKPKAVFHSPFDKTSPSLRRAPFGLSLRRDFAEPASSSGETLRANGGAPHYGKVYNEIGIKGILEGEHGDSLSYRSLSAYWEA
jgi:hypothetical protein